MVLIYYTSGKTKEKLWFRYLYLIIARRQVWKRSFSLPQATTTGPEEYLKM